VVDEQVTQPIESAVDDVEGIESIQSTSSGGFSVLVIEFALDTDTKEAEAELGSALGGVELPQQAQEPEVRSQSASEFPIMSVSLSAADGELAELTDYAREEAVPLIEDVEGVARADLVGGAEPEIEVELDAGRLKAYDVSADAVVGAIGGAASANRPVGDVEIDGLSTPVRTTSKLAGPAALRELPVGLAGGAVTAPRGAPTGAPEEVLGGVAPVGAATGVAPEPVMLGDVRRCERSLRTSPASRGPTASRASAST
jgi:hydrophobic/amphiphilic exporter-1 (mainly G- bacteria), HAE1 family